MTRCPHSLSPHIKRPALDLLMIPIWLIIASRSFMLLPGSAVIGKRRVNGVHCQPALWRMFIRDELCWVEWSEGACAHCVSCCLAAIRHRKPWCQRSYPEDGTLPFQILLPQRADTCMKQLLLITGHMCSWSEVEFGCNIHGIEAVEFQSPPDHNLGQNWVTFKSCQLWLQQDLLHWKSLSYEAHTLSIIPSTSVHFSEPVEKHTAGVQCEHFTHPSYKAQD